MMNDNQKRMMRIDMIRNAGQSWEWKDDAERKMYFVWREHQEPKRPDPNITPTTMKGNYPKRDVVPPPPPVADDPGWTSSEKESKRMRPPPPPCKPTRDSSRKRPEPSAKPMFIKWLFAKFGGGG